MKNSLHYCHKFKPVNRRPLCPLSNGSSNLQLLTPGHFSFRASFEAIPELGVFEIPPSRLRR